MYIDIWYVRKNGKVYGIDLDNEDFYALVIFILLTGNPVEVLADGTTASSAVEAVAQYKSGTIMNGLQPLIELLKDLAEPVSYGFMVKGGLQTMAGDEHEGKKTVGNAMKGYLLVKFIPGIFSMLRGISLG